MQWTLARDEQRSPRSPAARQPGGFATRRPEAPRASAGSCPDSLVFDEVPDRPGGSVGALEPDELVRLDGVRQAPLPRPSRAGSPARSRQPAGASRRRRAPCRDARPASGVPRRASSGPRRGSSLESRLRRRGSLVAHLYAVPAPGPGSSPNAPFIARRGHETEWHCQRIAAFIRMFIAHSTASEPATSDTGGFSTLAR